MASESSGLSQKRKCSPRILILCQSFLALSQRYTKRWLKSNTFLFLLEKHIDSLAKGSSQTSSTGFQRFIAGNLQCESRVRHPVLHGRLGHPPVTSRSSCFEPPFYYALNYIVPLPDHALFFYYWGLSSLTKSLISERYKEIKLWEHLLGGKAWKADFI